MIGHRHELARMQSDFYYTYYHKILFALLMSIVVMICLMLAIMYVVISEPKPQYYATTIKGEIIPMVGR